MKQTRKGRLVGNMTQALHHCLFLTVEWRHVSSDGWCPGLRIETDCIYFRETIIIIIIIIIIILSMALHADRATAAYRRS
jgi:hypothetical protein